MLLSCKSHCAPCADAAAGALGRRGSGWLRLWRSMSLHHLHCCASVCLVCVFKKCIACNHFFARYDHAAFPHVRRKTPDGTFGNMSDAGAVC
eukprot:42438-Amphidinium_carterae.1